MLVSPFLTEQLMSAKKLFEEAVTPWEIRAFHGNSNVQDLLRGKFVSLRDRSGTYSSNMDKFISAACDYVLGYVERYGCLPYQEFLKPRLRSDDFKFEVTIGYLLFGGDYDNRVKILNRLLLAASKLEEKQSKNLVNEMAAIIVKKSDWNLLDTNLNEFVTEQDLENLIRNNFACQVAELRAQNKPATKPAADAAPAAENG